MIYLLIGKSGVGKSTILKRLKEDGIVKPIVTCTTRPCRFGEIDGLDYHFMTDEEFYEARRNNKFLEWTSYKVANGETWYYGSLLEDFEDTSDRAIIVNPAGLKPIKRECKLRGIKTKTILLTCDPNILQSRLIKRRDNPYELKRRTQADAIDFQNIEDLVDITIHTDTDINTTIEQVIKIINKEKKISGIQNIFKRWHDRIIRRRNDNMEEKS